MMKTKGILLVLAFLVSVWVYGQQAEYTTEPVYGEFHGDLPTELVILTPTNLQQQKTRGFAKVKGNKVTITGTVKDGNGIKDFFINRFGVTVSTDGTFMKDILLREGENTVTFSVTDGKGNLFEQNYTLVSERSVTPTATASTEVSSQGKYYALLIGINEYEDEEIADLDKPIQDAEALAQVLTDNYIFEPQDVTILKNASRGQIIDALDRMRNIVTENDNLLLFYAGHGLWDADSEIGYWIPADGSKRSTADYFRNSTLTEQIGAIKSKHTLLIADACFSGAIFKSRRAFLDADVAVNKLYELPSRKAMTSGTLTEVPDKSAFLLYLNKRLTSNSDKYLPASRLFANIREVVINNSDVIPQYGTMQKVGDEGGEFIFIRRN